MHRLCRWVHVRLCSGWNSGRLGLRLSSSRATLRASRLAMQMHVDARGSWGGPSRGRGPARPAPRGTPHWRGRQIRLPRPPGEGRHTWSRFESRSRTNLSEGICWTLDLGHAKRRRDRGRAEDAKNNKSSYPLGSNVTLLTSGSVGLVLSSPDSPERLCGFERPSRLGGCPGRGAKSQLDGCPVQVKRGWGRAKQCSRISRHSLPPSSYPAVSLWTLEGGRHLRAWWARTLGLQLRATLS